MPAKQIPDLEWKFEEEVQLIEPVLIQIYHLPRAISDHGKRSPRTPAISGSKEN